MWRNYVGYTGRHRHQRVKEQTFGSWQAFLRETRCKAGKPQ